MNFDEQKIDEAVLALLYLGLHDGDRTWKSFDWDALNRLHAKGFIFNPVSKAKSVMFSEEGRAGGEIQGCRRVPGFRSSFHSGTCAVRSD